MSEWIKFERLCGNDLPLPQYETKYSAGMDFAACLKRPCFEIGTSKAAFIPTMKGSVERYELSEDEAKSWETTEGYLIEKEKHGLGLLNPSIVIEPDEVIMASLGFKCEFDSKYLLNLHVRSSIGIKGFMLANGTGIVDPDYRGELFALMWNRTKSHIIISHGQRIVQGVLTKFSQSIIQQNTVSESIRGENGFGSTGENAESV